MTASKGLADDGNRYRGTGAGPCLGAAGRRTALTYGGGLREPADEGQFKAPSAVKSSVVALMRMPVPATKIEIKFAPGRTYEKSITVRL